MMSGVFVVSAPMAGVARAGVVMPCSRWVMMVVFHRRWCNKGRDLGGIVWAARLPLFA